jgi:hypothetical protein
MLVSPKTSKSRLQCMFARWSANSRAEEEEEEEEEEETITSLQGNANGTGVSLHISVESSKTGTSEVEADRLSADEERQESSGSAASHSPQHQTQQVTEAHSCGTVLPTSHVYLESSRKRSRSPSSISQSIQFPNYNRGRSKQRRTFKGKYSCGTNSYPIQINGTIASPADSQLSSGEESDYASYHARRMLEYHSVIRYLLRGGRQRSEMGLRRRTNIDTSAMRCQSDQHSHLLS